MKLPLNCNRLLIIDDDLSLCETMALVGQRMGYETKYITTPLDAASLLSEWQPTVIITDLQMPQHDGIKLLNQLSALRVTAKIIVVSGTESKIMETAHAIGIQGGLNVIASIRKPFRAEELRNALQSSWRRPPINEREIEEAINDGEFSVHLQPKYNILAGQLVGAESLLRWHSKSRGPVAPEAIFTAVTSPELQDKILSTVLQQSLRSVELLRMNLVADTNFDLSINISAANVGDLTLPDKIEAFCRAHDWPVSRLTLELTETCALDFTSAVMEVMARLRLKGFQLSIDDFGTGFSSLLRLRNLPFTQLKIDRSFVANIANSTESSLIVEMTLLMAARLGLDVIAEGIGDKPTESRLIELGCQIGQGYHFCKPLSARELITRYGESRGRNFRPISDPILVS
jgi:EAL domain-containing protein (putative c-di-GMP-specific phosphodiesterase class I)/CheY-like chemotaxis protein